MQNANAGLSYGLLLCTNIHTEKTERSLLHDAEKKKKTDEDGESGIKISMECATKMMNHAASASQGTASSPSTGS